jgi:hypothetical protein
VTQPSGPQPIIGVGTASTPTQHVYFSQNGAAEYLGDVTPRQLKDLRIRGGGPRYVRIGQAVRYRSDWLDQWAEANAVSTTSEEAARRRT